MNEEWKDKLKKSMDGYEETAPEGLWSALGKALPDVVGDTGKVASEEGCDSGTLASEGGSDSPKASRSKRRSYILPLKIAAAAACVAGGVGLYLGNTADDGLPMDKIAQSGKLAESGNTRPIKSGAKVDSESDSKKLLATAYPSDVSSPSPYNIYKKVKCSDSYSKSVDPDTYSKQSNTDIYSRESHPNIDSKQSNTDNVYDGDNQSGAAENVNRRLLTRSKAASHEASLLSLNDDSYIVDYASQSGEGKFSATVYTAGNFVSSTPDNGGLMLMSCRQSALLSKDDAGNEVSVADAPTKTYILSSASNQKVKHHRPVRLGMSLRYALTSKWGIETGLAYTTLSTDMETGSMAEQYHTRQRLHFIGVPLAADYRIWQNRWLSFYAQVGGMMEKCVSGKLSTDYVINGNKVSTTDADLKMRQLQWSVNAALGLQFNFVKQLGAYFEPGIDYHFDNGSNIQSIYSDKPLQPSLKFGLRYQF